MQVIDLNLCGFTERKALHEYLSDALDLPPYYGGNLDALHSELVSITETTELRVRYSLHQDLFSHYILRLLEVLTDAAEENSTLSIVTMQCEKSDL
ncbi:MAG: barstar family protein [Clostridia bacterium]